MGQRSQLTDRTQLNLKVSEAPEFFLMVVRPLAAPSPGRTFEFCLESSNQETGHPLVKRLEMVIETYRNLNQRVPNPGLGTFTYQLVGDLCPLGQRSQLADRTAQLEGERGPGVLPHGSASSGCSFSRQNVRVLPGEEQPKLNPLVKRLEMVIETYRNLNQRSQTQASAPSPIS